MAHPPVADFVGQSTGVNPQTQEMADAKLALANAQADANQAWIKAKDVADKQFAITDAGNWLSMISGEANAAAAFTKADDAATAAESNAGAQAEADHMKADAQADSDHGTSDATATGGFEESEANSVFKCHSFPTPL